jgi:hypothetical protein
MPNMVVQTTSLGSSGWKATSASIVVVRRDLSAGLSPTLARLVDASPVQSSAASKRGQYLRSEAFVFASEAVAMHVLAAWSHARRARAVALGQGGFLVSQVFPTQVVSVVAWRERSRVGLLAIRAGRGVGTAQIALEFARGADSELVRPLPSTAWGQLEEQVQPNGSVSMQTALQAVVLAYGPLPGVKVPAGRRTAQTFADVADDWIFPYLPRLSGRLARAVYRELGLTPPGHGAYTSDYGDPGFHLSGPMTDEADKWAAQYAKLLGVKAECSGAKPLPCPGEFEIYGPFARLRVVAGATTTPLGVGVQGKTWPVNAKGQRNIFGPYCRIRVGAGGPDPGFILAHEVFHCFEYVLPTFEADPAWVAEGLADWAAASVDPDGSHTSQEWMDEYLKNPQQSLFKRGDDAMGFFGHAADVLSISGENLWSRIKAILHDDQNDTAVYDDAGGNSEKFLSTWGSSVFRDSAGGWQWQMFSPQPPSDIEDPIVDITEDYGAGVPAYTTAQYSIYSKVGDPLLYVRIDPNDGRLSTTYQYTKLDGAWFCMTSSCGCPSGTEGKVPASSQLPDESDLGVTGDPSGGTAVEVLYEPLSRFCHPESGNEGQPNQGTGPTTGAGSGGDSPNEPEAGEAASFGDPHMLDFEGGIFDFQQAGEFTLVKSTQDDLQIQARQQPIRYACVGSSLVAYNKAFAMRVGSVTVQVEPRSPGDVVYVNRVRIGGLRFARHLAGGGSVVLSNGDFVVTWPDGSTAEVDGGEGVAVTIHLARARRGHVEGVLGNWGVPASSEFVGRDGRHYPQSTITGVSGADVSARYERFGASWRITPHESLFVYPPGKSTNSYTIRDFPEKLGTLPPARLAAGQKTCGAAGIADAKIYAACVFDVGATCDTGFATSDKHLSSVVSAASPLPPTGGGGIWSELSSGVDEADELPPSLAMGAGGKVLAAYMSDNDSGVNLASFAPMPGAPVTIKRTTVLSSGGELSPPILLPSAGGAKQLMISGEIPEDSDSLPAGVDLFQLQPDGSFGAPIKIDSGGSLDDSALLSSNGKTPLWTADHYQGTLGLEDGLELEDGSTDPPKKYELPAGSMDGKLGRARTGGLWVAWYQVASTDVKGGVYLLRLDPATGAPLPGATPLLAPHSAVAEGPWSMALACNSICHVVYTPEISESGVELEESKELVSWAPGQAAPTVLVNDGKNGAVISEPLASVAPDGRLWIAYAKEDLADGNHIVAQLGDDNGAGGASTTIASPLGVGPSGYGAALATSEGLVLVYPWQQLNTAAQEGSTIWATVVRAR